MHIHADTHFGDYVGYLQGFDIHSHHHHLLLACMPKSGSTWLRTILSSLPGFHSAELVNGWDRREQELSEIQLLLNHRSNYVAQLHIRYSEPTAWLMQRFCLKPIVVVRNIFDIVPSIRDQLHQVGGRGPISYLSPEMTAWPSDKVDDFIVDLVLPWYFNFFLCWTECENKLLLTYEELRQDTLQVLEKVCDHYSIGATRSQINDAISAATRENTRMNKGEIGRGTSLSAAAKQRILTLASYYEGVDFTPIGISPEPSRSQMDQGYIVSSRITCREPEAVFAGKARVFPREELLRHEAAFGTEAALTSSSGPSCHQEIENARNP